MFAAIIGFVGLVLLFGAESDGGWQIWCASLTWLVIALYFGRVAMTGIWLRPEGLTLRTTFRTYELEWAEIDSFRLRETIDSEATLLVKLVDGREIGAVGLEPRWPGDQQRTERIVAELERRRAASCDAGSGVESGRVPVRRNL